MLFFNKSITYKKLCLILVSGGYDLLNALQYIESDNKLLEYHKAIVLYSSGNVPKPLREGTQRLAETSALCDSYHFHIQKSNGHFIKWLKKTFRATELCLVMWRVFKKPEAQLIDELEPHHLVLVENGISTYMPPLRGETLDQSSFPKKLKTYLSAAFLPLMHRFGVPEYVPKQFARVPSIEDYQNFCQQTSEKLNLQERGQSSAGKKTLVIIGTSLYRLHVIDEEEEKSTYRAYCEAALANGYEVYWKPHPRANTGSDWLSDYQVTRIDSMYPLELFLPQFSVNPLEVASIASTGVAIGEIYFGAKPIILDIPTWKNGVSRLPHIDLIRNTYKGTT